MLDRMVDVAREIGRDRDARGVVVCGSDGFFSSGGDLREFANVRTARGAREVTRLGRRFIEGFRALGIPFVAAINGHAYGGGCELASACDLRIMEAQAKLHWVQGRMAVTTGWGATSRLVGIVGPGVAASWLLSAATVDSATALAAGFAERVVPTGASVDAACAWIQAVATVPDEASREQLALIRKARDTGERAALVAEANAFTRLWNGKAHHDAVARFLSRRSSVAAS